MAAHQTVLPIIFPLTRRTMVLHPKRLPKLLAWLLGAFVVAVYAPSWLYLGHLAGLTPKPSLEGVQVSMSVPWYPILSTESFPGRPLLNTSRPTLVFLRPNWPLPWLANDVTMVRISRPEADVISKAQGMISESKQYGWGLVVFMEREQLALIEPYNISVSSKHPFDQLRSAIGDIKELHTTK